ncbi:MAG TPA: ATP-binding protein [Gemmataceae bacterium]|nr:ATP-binding protein [Gemmataceae bacterium]
MSSIGKVASPPRKESTSEEFFFWIKPDTLIEKTQIVKTKSAIGSQEVTFYGLVTEVFRQSRQSDMGQEIDRYDGDVNYEPPFDSPGFNYAQVTILRTVPAVLCPPKEGCDVLLGEVADAQMAYGADEIENKLAVGVVKNGAVHRAGPGFIDTDYLLGANGGHMNVNGVAGRGTKSSFLLHCNYLLLREARRLEHERPSDPERLRVVPIILNVKNFDLFHIDRLSKRFKPDEHLPVWKELGISDPAPFRNVAYFAPQQKDMTIPVDTGRPTADVRPYSWSLRDIIERGLFTYLFAEEDVYDANFGALVMDLENKLTQESERGDKRVRTLQPNQPATFDELLEMLKPESQGEKTSALPGHAPQTVKKLYRRFLRLLLEGGAGILRRRDQHGHPLDVTAKDTRDPVVIDLSALSGLPQLQRFVVATIFRQLVEERTGSNVQKGLVYLVTLDELNRFAPRGSHDPITELIERVAAEMRSQGILLFGAQQQASLVSARVIENAGLKALGKSGSLELDQQVWRFLSDSARKKAVTLLPNEKMLIQDSFREPMLVEVPFPPWALRGQDAVLEAGGKNSSGFSEFENA